jgi:hypothetical protein
MTTQVSKTASSNVTLVASGINGCPVVRFSGTGSLKGTYAVTPSQPALIFAVATGRVGTGQQYLGDIYSNSNAGAMGMVYDATTGKYAVDYSSGTCSITNSTYDKPSLVRVFYTAVSGNNATSGSYTALDGISVASCGGNRLYAPTGQVEIGGRTWDVAGRYFVGDIAEVIYFNSNTATAAQINRIESYLAFKYGLTLGSTSAIKDYVASDGTTIFWSGNNSYQNNVFGIGTDNGSGLTITQSNSMNTGNGDGSGQSGKGNIFLSASTGLNDKQFLMIGNDAGALSEQTSNVPAIYSGSTRIGRTWKVKNTGSAGSVNLSFDVTGLTVSGGTDPAKYRLMVNTNGSTDFTTGTPVIYAASSIASNKINFTGVTLTDNSVFTFITNSTVPLPVTWVSFSLTMQKGMVDLKWKTADEINVDKYLVEHSLNGTAYTGVATISAKGGSQLNEYAYSYKETSAGIHYYRIKEVDRDGSYKYSSIKSVAINNASTLQIQSNQVYQSLSVVVNSAMSTKAKLQIANTEGKVLIEQDASFSQGKNLVSINVSNLPQGIYFLQTVIGDAVINAKFLKLIP